MDTSSTSIVSRMRMASVTECARVQPSGSVLMSSTQSFMTFSARSGPSSKCSLRYRPPDLPAVGQPPGLLEPLERPVRVPESVGSLWPLVMHGAVDPRERHDWPVLFQVVVHCLVEISHGFSRVKVSSRRPASHLLAWSLAAPSDEDPAGEVPIIRSLTTFPAFASFASRTATFASKAASLSPPIPLSRACSSHS